MKIKPAVVLPGQPDCPDTLVAQTTHPVKLSSFSKQEKRKKNVGHLIPVANMFLAEGCTSLLQLYVTKEAQWPIGYGVGLRIKRSSVRIQPWPLH